MRRGWPRSGALFGVSLGCLLLLCWLWGWSSIGAWFAAGLVGGLLGGRYSRVWVVWLAAIAYAPLSVWLGLADLTDITGHWWPVGQTVLAALVGCIVTLGFVTGVALGWRGRAWERLRSDWTSIGHRSRMAALAVTLAAPAFLAGFTVFAGVVGSDLWLNAVVAQDCRTPEFAYGWTYEAINYDITDDLTLDPQQPKGTWKCASQGSPAADQVVTSDGTSIAGWYIAAANDVGPNGPTVVVVPGGKSNKSGMLKYLPALHDRYNLVVLDDRGMGRSYPGTFSFGLNEARDVDAVLDWLVREKNPAWIGALGNSLGAETALAAAVKDKRISALVLDSMQARAETAAGNILETEWGVPALPGAWAIIAFASLHLGDDIAKVDPLHTITLVGGDRPVLLIHGTADVIDVPEQSVELNFRAALAAGVPVELRYCRGGTHGMLPDPPTDALPDGCGADWARWVRAFFDDALAQL